MAEPGRTEQIVSQFLLKVLHAVLGARIPHLHRADLPRKRDRWFNLAVGDLPPALDSPAFFHPAVMDPLVIDLILSPRDPAAAATDSIVERWTALCDPPPPWSASSSSSLSSSIYKKAYKNTILLLRSLYSLLRLLPAHRVFKILSASSNSSYNISYKISSFAEPFTREEEANLKLHTFAPVETMIGNLAVSVAYRPSLAEFDLDASSLSPPVIIPDYVGSPAADPMRAFPASMSSARATSSAPPSLARPHSWNTARAAEMRFSPADAHKRGNSFSFDEFRLSPPFSTSPTPSPPTIHPMQSRLRSETAPVSIPHSAAGKSLMHRTGPNLSDPTRSLLPPMSPRSTRGEQSSQDSTPGSRSFRKSEGSRVGDFYSNLQWYTTQQKVQQGALRDGRDDSGRFSGVLSSGGSPHFGISRSSSRLSIPDDLDDGDFPFAVDDVDSLDSQTRNLDGKQVSESAPSSTSSHKSDAAVGVLVHMLKTAPRLRQDDSSSISSKSTLGGEVGASSFFVSRKASDALEELRTYRDLKDMLLSQSGAR